MKHSAIVNLPPEQVVFCQFQSVAHWYPMSSLQCQYINNQRQKCVNRSQSTLTIYKIICFFGHVSTFSFHLRNLLVNFQQKGFREFNLGERLRLNHQFQVQEQLVTVETRLPLIVGLRSQPVRFH